MDLIRIFEKNFGGRWAGISFHKIDIHESIKDSRQKHFCEAVMESSRNPVVLCYENIICPGAVRSMGWDSGIDNVLAQRMTELRGIDHETALSIINKVPKVKDVSIKAVTIGHIEAPDMLISFIQPEAAMRLVQKWSNITGENLDFSESAEMSVCGSVVAGSYMTGKIKCSFGCPEARKHGQIGRDRMIIGVPVEIAEKFG